MSNILNNELTHKHEAVLAPSSKLLGRVLRVMQKNGYLGEFEFVDDGQAGKFKVQLLGRINYCAAIRPRYSVRTKELEDWLKRFLPSRNVGVVIISTPKGVLSHAEAVEQKTGGRLIAYVY